MKKSSKSEKTFTKKGGKKAPSYSGGKKTVQRKPSQNRPRPVFQTENGVDSENIVAGRNPVSELLRSGRTVDKLYIAHGEREGSIVKIVAEARNRGIPVVEADRYKLESIAGTPNHQGVVAFATDYEYCDPDAILNYAEEKGEKPFIVILDGVTDPRNLGAIVRTAECCGVHGIVIPKRGCCGLTATVFKAAAGACEFMKIAKVTNIAETIERLKEKGVWVYAADGDGDCDLYSTDLTGAVAVVLGDEGKGISRLVRQRCDGVISIPMFGNINSLNVSVAGAVMMYEAVRQKTKKENAGG